MNSEDADVLFPEALLKAGDTIDGKGERLYSRDIFKGMLFVQDHSGLFQVCQIKEIEPQIVFSDGSRELGYTKPEYIDDESGDFESCLFWRVPQNFKKTKEVL